MTIREEKAMGGRHWDKGVMTHGHRPRSEDSYFPLDPLEKPSPADTEIDSGLLSPTGM